MGKITLKEIAALAGVHKSTVDKVIHNRPGVSDARRQQIQKLLDEYGYESNPLAKALNYQKKKMKIAVVLPQVSSVLHLRQGMEQVQHDLNSFNIEILYCETKGTDAAEQAACLRSLRNQAVSGIVLLPLEDPQIAEELEALAEAQIPVVTVNSSNPQGPSLCHVEQNAPQAGTVAARILSLLLPCGGEVGVISSEAVRAVKEREISFDRHLREISEEPQDSRWTIGEIRNIHETPQEAYRETLALLDRHPQLKALYITCGCVSDICRAVEDRGLSGTVKIICYECYPEIIALINRGVVTCTISSDLLNQGRLSMRLLFEYLVYDRKPASNHYYTTNEILFRENLE